MEPHAVRYVNRLHETTEIRAQHAFERELVRSDDVNGDAALAQRRGYFKADEAGADDERACGASGLRDDRAGICPRAKVKDRHARRTRNWQLHRLGTGGDQQRSGTVGSIHRNPPSAFSDRASSCGGPGPDRSCARRTAPSTRSASSRPALHRPGNPSTNSADRRADRIGADDRDRTFVSFTANHVRSGRSCRAAADDENGVRSRASSFARGASEDWRWRGGELLANECGIAGHFNTPARNRIERRSAECLARAQTDQAWWSGQRTVSPTIRPRASRPL